MTSLTIEHAEQVTLQIGNPNDAAVRSLLESLVRLPVRTDMTDKPAGRSDSEVLRASALTPPAYGSIWPGQGGRFVGTMPAMFGLPTRYLIASEDELEDTKYGGYGKDEPDATSRYNGPGNTAALLASEHDHPAAKWCAAYRADGHDDFFLPSQADLFMAMVCAPESFKKEGWYLSSTQYSADSAFVQDFANGNSLWYRKYYEFRARAFRWIRT